MGHAIRSLLASAYPRSTFPRPPAPTRQAGVLGVPAVCPGRPVPGDRGLRARDGEGPSCPSGDTMQFLERLPGSKPCPGGWRSEPPGQGPAGPRSRPAVWRPHPRQAPCLGTCRARRPLPAPPPPQKPREPSRHLATRPSSLEVAVRPESCSCPQTCEAGFLGPRPASVSCSSQSAGSPAAFYTWRNAGRQSTPLLLGAANIFNPVYMASSSDTETVLPIVSPHPRRMAPHGCFQTQAPTDQIKMFCFVTTPARLPAAPARVPGPSPPCAGRAVPRGTSLPGGSTSLEGGLPAACTSEGLGPGVRAGQRLGADLGAAAASRRIPRIQHTLPRSADRSPRTQDCGICFQGSRLNPSGSLGGSRWE